jgi:hypothetical protein
MTKVRQKEVHVAPFDEFEKLPGGAPYRLLGSHPDGNHVAMQAKAYTSGRSAVWEKETKRIAWRPERAIALAWLRNGTQIGVLREANDAPYEFALYSWPEAQLLHRCPVSPPPGWGEMLDLLISPQGDLALCQWIDQSQAGFEFVDINPQGVSHDSQAGYFLEGTNDVTRPAFSPDGQLWAFGYKRYEIWWVPDPEDIDAYNQPARGGEYPLGALQVFRGKQPLSRTIPLIATLPAGWLPADPNAEEVLSIGDPVFLDAQYMQVRLPSGETQVYSVPVE